MRNWGYAFSFLYNFVARVKFEFPLRSTDNFNPARA
jgi:hypothetical protein